MTTTPLPAVLHILGWELLRLRAYKDAVGKWTIGWGHLILPNEQHLLKGEITRQQAHALFLVDLVRKEREVNAAIPKVLLEDYQRGALVAFCFNSGVAALGPTMGLGKALREGQFSDVPDEMRRWVYGTDEKTGRKVRLTGLVARREDEVALWEGA